MIRVKREWRYCPDPQRLRTEVGGQGSGPSTLGGLLQQGVERRLDFEGLHVGCSLSLEGRKAALHVARVPVGHQALLRVEDLAAAQPTRRDPRR